jgi:hypothetical protein
MATALGWAIGMIVNCGCHGVIWGGLISGACLWLGEGLAGVPCSWLGVLCGAVTTLAVSRAVEYLQESEKPHRYKKCKRKSSVLKVEIVENGKTRAKGWR